MRKVANRTAQKERGLIQRNEVAGQLSSLLGPPVRRVEITLIESYREGHETADSLFFAQLASLEIFEQMTEE